MHDAQLKFYTLVDYMISFNKELRVAIAQETMGAATYAKECMTVRCNIGRRSGKTQYIIDRAGPDDLVIIHNMVMMDTYRRGNLRTNILTASEVQALPNVYRGCIGPIIRRFRNIYVDEVTLCEKYLNLNEMYNILARDKDQTFILLGT